MFLFHHEEKRSTEDAIKLFSEVEKIRNASSPIPVFVFDDWDSFKEGLVNVYGKIGLSQYKSIGRKPLPKLIPVEDLRYIKVCKKKVKGYLVETIQCIIFGDPEEIFKMLGKIRMTALGLHM